MKRAGIHKLQLKHKVSTEGITENQGHLPRRGRTAFQPLGVRGKDQGDLVKTKVGIE